MMNAEMELLMTQFGTLAQDTELNLKQMLARVAGGQVPAQEEVRALDGTIARLQTVYGQIRTVAEQWLEDEEMPPEGSPAAAYATALEESKARRFHRQFEQLENTIHGFLAVKSVIAAYGEALRPFQEEAKAMLAELSEAAQPEITEEMTESVRRQKLLLDAIALEDPDTEEGFDLFEQLAQVYPARVQQGVSRGKYYVEAPEEEPSAGEVPAEAAVLVPAAVVPPQSAVEPEKEEAPVAAEKGQAPAAPVPVEVEPQTAEPENVPVPETMIAPTRKIKEVQPSASAFRKDWRKFSPLAAHILPLLTNLGLLTPTMAMGMAACTECYIPKECRDAESYAKAMENLAARNILGEYRLEGCEEPLYCLTGYAYGSMKKESVQAELKNYWDLTLGDNRVCAKNEMPESLLTDRLQHNALLMAYFSTMFTGWSRERYKQVQESILWVENAYQVAVVDRENRTHVCRLVSADEVRFQGEELVVLLDDEMLPQPENGWRGGMGFCLEDETLYQWDGEWIELTPDIPQEPEENEPEALQAAVPETAEEQPAPVPLVTEKAALEEFCEEILPGEVSIDGPEMEEVVYAEPVMEQPEDPLAETKAQPVPEPARFQPRAMGVDGPLDELIRGKTAPGQETFLELIRQRLERQTLEGIRKKDMKELVQALLLARAASFVPGYDKCKKYYNQLLLATNLPLEDQEYTGDNLLSVFADAEEGTEAMMLAAYCYALICPQEMYDYNLQSRSEQLLEDFELLFPNFGMIKPLLHKLCSVPGVYHEGFSANVLGQLGDEAEHAEYTEKLQKQASSLLSEPVIKAKMNGLPEMCSALFGQESELYLCMKYIAENDRGEKPFVAEVLWKYCDQRAGASSISMARIEAELDKQWGQATKGKSTSRAPLLMLARKQSLEAFRQRVTLMKTWVEYEDTKTTEKLPALRKLKGELQQIIRVSMEQMEHLGQENQACIILWMLCKLQDHLNGQIGDEAWVFADLLRTGMVQLDGRGAPVLRPDHDGIQYYEPWRNVLKHIANDKTTLEEAREETLSRDSLMFDNLQQLELINRLLGDEEEKYLVTEQQELDARNAAKVDTKRFVDELELAFTYDRISEYEKENILALLDQNQESFFTGRAYGCWRQFLEALRLQVDAITEVRGQVLIQRIRQAKEAWAGEDMPKLLTEAERIFTESRNFAVAEEYLNRLNSGEKEIAHAEQMDLREEDSFMDFLSDGTYMPIYNESVKNVRRTLKQYGWDYVSARLPKDWRNRQIESAKQLITNWPAGLSSAMEGQADKIFNLLRSMGLDVRHVEKVKGAGKEIYRLALNSTSRNKADYPHPISAFGTQAKANMNVVVLYGSHTAKQLVDTVTGLNLGGMSIVLLDAPVDRSMRRLVAEIFHTQTSGQNPFLLIDRVLAIYMAMHQDTERLPILLKCTLPYTTYQPFVRDGGATADEMFCGRTKELATIMDPNGACVVYGGRQLGKTALLERAESRCNKPEYKAYAVYCSIDSCTTEAALADKIVTDVNRKTDLNLDRCDTLDALCGQIYQLMKQDRIATLLLLMDEADRFLDSISATQYSTLQPLVDLKRQTTNNFKFVLAGLHNVCRARNATAQNGIFGQLGTPLCIEPLSPTDALMLISRPLRYLGFRIDQVPHMETILTNTNYYPGILQFFGYTLVQTLTSQYGEYYRAVDGNPPFTLRDDQLGAIMNSADLNRSIKDKFRWSLELDQRYFMLARCIALLYLTEGDAGGRTDGFTVKKIMETANTCEIRCLVKESERDCATLLDEMVSMGILSKTSEKSYRLRRHSFINIIGADMDVLYDEILAGNEEGE